MKQEQANKVELKKKLLDAAVKAIKCEKRIFVQFEEISRSNQSDVKIESENLAVTKTIEIKTSAWELEEVDWVFVNVIKLYWLWVEIKV